MPCLARTRWLIPTRLTRPRTTRHSSTSASGQGGTTTAVDPTPSAFRLKVNESAEQLKKRAHRAPVLPLLERVRRRSPLNKTDGATLLNAAKPPAPKVLKSRRGRRVRKPSPTSTPRAPTPPSLDIEALETQLSSNTRSIQNLQGSLKKGQRQFVLYPEDSTELRLLKLERRFLKAQRALAQQQRKSINDDKSQKLLTKVKKKGADTHTLQYSRRLEGVLEDTEEPVLQEIDPGHPPRSIATLAHGLQRVLFNPNVHWLQDPHSKVYNFPSTIRTLPPVSSFAFDRVGGFVTSSKDGELASLAVAHSKRFTGSTSSLSGFLSHIYYLISGHRPPDVSTLSAQFQDVPRGFSGGTKIPTAVALRKLPLADDLYAMDSLGDKEESNKNVLTYLGTMLEKYLTVSEDDFRKLLKGCQPSEEGYYTPEKEAYRYSKSSKFVMRSQLDCHDPRLPGSGVFDIKTRACIAIRVDRLNWVENAGYQIKKQTGLFESFEREYFDLIRSAFLKFQFQVRIGNMDGVFVAYHNTAQLFGFQYIPLVEMDECLFGGHQNGNRVFRKCVDLLEALAEEVVGCYPGQTVRCLVETIEGRPMSIWVQPGALDSDSLTTDENTPLSLLLVTVDSYVDKRQVPPDEAITSPSNNWSLRYTISHSAMDSREIWKSFKAAMERKNMAMYLPSGVSVEDFLKQWNAMDFGSADANAEGIVISAEDTVESLQTSKKFLPAHRTIKLIRKLARQGRAEVAAANGGRTTFPQPKAWGMPIENTFETADGFGHIIFQERGDPGLNSGIGTRTNGKSIGTVPEKSLLDAIEEPQPMEK